MKLYGAYVALITPFKKDGSVDYEKLESLVEFQIINGISGIVALGTTAETPTLSEKEYEKVLSTIIKKVNKRVTVITGAGSNSTSHAVELTKKCKELGADVVLSTCPYYNKPSQRGIIAHFTKVSEVGIPVIIYNVPGRTGINILPETIYELSKNEMIIGVKEASGNIDQMIQIHKLCGDEFNILSGDDNLIMPAFSVGARGVISVVANILPDKISKFYKTTFTEQIKIHEYLYEISKNLFIEGNPVTVKEAMDILNISNNVVRLPLVSATNETREKLKDLFKKKGIL